MFWSCSSWICFPRRLGFCLVLLALQLLHLWLLTVVARGFGLHARGLWFRLDFWDCTWSILQLSARTLGSAVVASIASHCSGTGHLAACCLFLNGTVWRHYRMFFTDEIFFFFLCVCITVIIHYRKDNFWMPVNTWRYYRMGCATGLSNQIY